MWAVWRYVPFFHFHRHILCKSGFSALVSMKTKFRNKLECEADLRCALSSTKPRIKRLVSQNSCILHTKQDNGK